MKKIIYTRPDGGLSVVTPVINSFPVPEPITEDQALARALAKLPTDAINPQVVDPSAIPTDRTFRNAWTQSGPAIVQDMPKCRALWREHLRQLRAPKLAALDTDYLRADELGDAAEKARIAARKQALRDVTADPMIDAANTPAELKLAIPDALK